MRKDTFTPYYGEFLVSPIPVELSFNWCSHACEYCFANLNRPDRKAGIKSTINLIQQCHNRDSIEAYFLRERYPTLISNRVDPFAVSNYRQALPVIELMTGLGMPIAFQTKGGRGIDEVLQYLPPSCWYLSIAMFDDDIRKKLEPGAPTISERLALIERLVDTGHSVSVGINPAVPEWLPNPELLIKAIASRGAYGAWIEPLHFNYKQVARMTDRGRDFIGEEIIARAKKKQCPAEYIEYLDSVEAIARENGIETFSIDSPSPSRYWEPFETIYPKTLPTLQGFINHLVATHGNERRFVHRAEFMDYMAKRLPQGNYSAGHYIGATAHNVCREVKNWSNWMTFAELLEWLWWDDRIKMCPVRNRAFSWACDRFSGDLITRFDREGAPIMVFDVNGFDNLRIEV